MKKLLLLTFVFFAILSAETLFEVKDASNNKVLDVSTDGLRILNGADTLMVISTDGIRAYIQKDAKGLSRTFSVTTASSKDGEAKSQNKVFEVATDQGSTFFNPLDNTDKIFSVSKNSIIANVNTATGRDYLVNNTTAGKIDNNLMKISYKDTFEAINDSTMLYYKKKNAFRVGYIKIDTDNEVGQASFATGYQNKASGPCATALGIKTESTGYGSTSMGTLTKAQAISSTAMGSQTTASGYNSTATGWLTTAQSINEFTCGSLNIDWGSANNWIPTDPQFIIGNGIMLGLNQYQYSNALTVLKNGNTSIGNIIPNSKLDVAGDVRINDNVLYLRGPNDLNHGLRYVSSWYSTSVNGPALFGYGGGALATINGALSLTWNDLGTVKIPEGHLIVSSGDIAVTSGDMTVSSGDVYFPKVYSTFSTGGKYVRVDSSGKLYSTAAKEDKDFPGYDEIETLKTENQKLKEEITELKNEFIELKKILNIK